MDEKWSKGKIDVSENVVANSFELTFDMAYDNQV